MSFIEIAGAALALDLEFLADVILNNLFWIFGFFAAGYFFSSGNKGVIIGLLFATLVLVSMDFFALIQFSIYTAYGLMLLYLVRMLVLLFLENTKGGSRIIPLFWVLSFFFVMLIIAVGGV